MDSADLEVASVMHRLSDTGEWIDFFLTVKRWEGEPYNREPDKCSEMAWYSLDGLPGDMIPHVRQAVENVLAGVFYDSYGWQQ